MKNLVYFSAADRQMESFLDDDAFERSLILNILFQDGLLIPDIFCFVSNFLRKHLLARGPQSLFEVGIKHGLVVPTFRGQGTSSFQETLDIIQAGGDSDAAIHGVLDTASDTASRLQKAADEGGELFKPAALPKTHLATSYDSLMTRKLASLRPPRVDEFSGLTQPEVDRVWSLTEQWRTECIEIARAKSGDQLIGGLLRGKVLDAVGKAVGLPFDYKVNDVKEVQRLLKGKPKMLEAVNTFFRWMNDLYQMNHARAFGVIPNIPDYGPISGLLIRDADNEEPKVHDLSPVRTISLTAELPAIKTLYKIDPENLMAIRKEVGPDYFKSIRAWQLDQSSPNAQKVADKLTEYCAAISKQCRERVGYADVDFELFLASVDPRTRDVLEAASQFLNTAPLVKQCTDSLVALTRFGYACYRWIIHRPKEHGVPVRSIELDLPREENSNNDSNLSRKEDSTADSEMPRE